MSTLGLRPTRTPGRACLDEHASSQGCVTPAAESDDRGAIAVVTALLSVVLFGMAALAIDVASWYVEGQKLQRAADAAALAGVPYMPNDLAEARTQARNLVSRNGYDGAAVPDSDIVGVANRPSQLQVTLRSNVQSTFGQVLGIDSKQVVRAATADFAAAAAMGSPCNVMGNEPLGASEASVAAAACPSTPNFWQNIAGPEADKAKGDRFATRRCAAGNSNCSGTTNLDYAGGAGVGGQPYYVYKITPKAGVTSMDVQLFDPMFVDVGDHCETTAKLPTSWPGGASPNPYVSDAGTRYAGGDASTGASGTFCTGDYLFDRGANATAAMTNASKLNTTFAVLNPTDTLDPMSSTVVPNCKRSYGGFSGNLVNALTRTNGAYDDTLASNFRQWVTLCTINTPQAGKDYYLLVRTNVPASPPTTASDSVLLNPAEVASTGGNGHNRYGLRVTPHGAGTVAVSALERMPIYANLQSGTTDFYLARVASANAGALLTVSFFDTGDASGEAVIAIKDPSGAAPDGCLATGDVRTSPHSDFNATTCTLSKVYSGNGYDGKIQRVQVPIPSTYTCVDADPTACWYRLKFTYPAGVTAQDTTTWSASLDGDPVRLVK